VKKVLCATFALMILALSACKDTSVQNNGSANEGAPVEVRYSVLEACYASYRNAQEMIDGRGLYDTVVFTGKVTGISFQVLDLTTALPPTEKTEQENRRLNTRYDVDILTSYGGETSKSIQIIMDGGLKEYRTEEQLKLVKEKDAWPSDSIPVFEDGPEIKIGETYLFVCAQFEDGSATLINLDQSVYSLSNPFAKNTIGKEELEEPEAYYAKKTDQYGNALISAKDVISAFGEDKWDTFWAQWQKDNPKWEARIDKKSVEKALAKE